MGRPRRKALYEIIRSQHGDRAISRPERPEPKAAPRHVVAPSSQRQPLSSDPGERLPWRWFRPGQVIRLPIGHLLVGAAAIAAILVVAYLIGVGKGQARNDSMDNARFLMPALTTDQRPQDPLNQRHPPSAPSDRPLTGTAGAIPDGSRATTNTRPNETTPGTPVTQTSNWGPIESDPRQRGLNYFVLAATHQEGAIRLAEFCRANGLETYAVGGQNSRLVKVIALPGFGSAERSSNTVKALESRIHRIGDRWKHYERGASDLRDAYPERYGG